MFTGDKNGNIVISFLGLSPAEASILAKELKQELLLLDGVTADQIRLVRASDDAQDVGSILAIAMQAGLGLSLADLARAAAKGVVAGAASRVGQGVVDAVWPTLRKWGARAKVKTPSGELVILGEDFGSPAAPRSAADLETLADLKTLGLVILGASTFPHYPASRKLDNAAFKRSAELAKKVLSPAHTVFRNVEVLDLFDQALRPDDIVDRIEDHVEAHPRIRDVVLYYCGHGDLLPDREHTYYLVLKGTKPGREVTTGLGIKQFRTMIDAKGVLTRRRCTFILDCCFAGEAAGAWQSAGLNTLIGKQIRDVLPSSGFAFLTASDKDERAWGRGGHKDATMFTGALAEVLTADTFGAKRLSLNDLCAAMAERIRDRHGWKEAVIPQCHAPRQVDGDISRIPMFLAGNPGLVRPRLEFSSQIDALPAHVAPASTPTNMTSTLYIAAQEWAKIEQSADIEGLKLFAVHFPGYYGALALRRVALLNMQASEATPAAPVPPVPVPFGQPQFQPAQRPRKERIEAEAAAQFATELAKAAQELFNCAYAAHESGDYDRAIARYSDAIRLKPDYAKAYYKRGEAYAHKGEYDRAISDFDQAIRLNPDDASAYCNRGLAHCSKGDEDRAISDYGQAICLKPDYADAYQWRGLSHIVKGDYGRAIFDCDQLIGLKPDDADGYFNRGLAHIGKGDYDRAISDCDQAIRLKPDYADAYNIRGAASYHKKDYARAIGDYDRALQIDPNHEDAAARKALAEKELPKTRKSEGPSIVHVAVGMGGGRDEARPIVTGTGESFKDIGTGPEMVVIPAGKFVMGSPAGEEGRYDDEGPQHQVRIGGPFALGRFAVTLAEFGAFVEATGHAMWGTYKNLGFSQTSRHPVVGVNWNDAAAYCYWLSKATGKDYRLPSEAEWEYACRAGTATPFWWGSFISTDDANYDGNCTYGGGKKGQYRNATAGVESFKQNPWGLYQMHGNVWEWCADAWHENYRGAPEDGFVWQGGNQTRRVLRGGSWLCNPQCSRAARRARHSSEYRRSDIGFRVARTLLTS